MHVYCCVLWWLQDHLLHLHVERWSYLELTHAMLDHTLLNTCGELTL